MNGGIKANPKAIITGANRGIGKCFALESAKRGYDLVLIARNSELLEKCSKEIRDRYDVDITIISSDLSKTEDVNSIASRISEDPTIELLINNAGFAVPSFFVDSDIDAQLDMVHVHNEATLRLTRAVLPTMKNNRKGAIINVASTLAYIPFVANSVYCASKAFINVFSDVVQREVKKYGIIIQALNPGLTETDFHKTGAFTNVDKIDTPMKAMAPEVVVDISFRQLGKKLIVIPGSTNKLMTLFKEPIARVMMNKKGI